jgi:hypothetical protein
MVIMPKKGARPIAETASCTATQSVLADAKPVIENVAAPQAEAKNRVKDDPLALLNELAKNRWNRKCKLLPNLRLTYPSDDESRQIAELAGIDYSSWFCHHIHSIILDAHLNHASFLTLSIPEVRTTIEGVATQTNRLGEILSKLDVGRGSRGSKEYAGWLIERELVLQQLEVGGMVLLPQYIELLHGLSSAAQRAAQKPMHPPKGAGGNPAFDSFIEDLLMAGRMLGGSWSNSRSRDQIWKGTLLEALEILKEYLPRKGFLPPGELGRSVEHIRTKLNDHIRRAPDIRILKTI